MNEQVALQTLLQKRFSEMRIKNPSFSLRAFARRLDLNSGALSAFLNGKRRVSRKMAARIADSLGLDPQERSEVLARFATKPSLEKIEQAQPLQYLQLTADQFRIIAKWHHFAILSLIRTRGFKSHPKWIAGRLGITLPQAQEALSRLARLGFISVDENGRIQRTKSKYRTTDDVVSLSLRQGHAENLELAKESLLRDSIEQRDFTAATMAIDPKKLPEAKERIRKFQDDLADFLESGEQTEVYKICVQLFPLTTLEEGNKHDAQ
jgi:uncharacterized protein (TIGR02147 family)